MLITKQHCIILILIDVQVIVTEKTNIWLCTCLCSVCQVLYKHEGQTALKVLDKAKTSVNLPLPKDNGYAVLEIRSWGEGGDGPAHEIIVSQDSGEKPRSTQQSLVVI